MRTLTPPALEAFTHCPRKYQYSYVWKISPIIYNSPLMLGKGLRAGLTDLHTKGGARRLPGAMLAARAAMKDDLRGLRKMMDADEFDEALEQAKRDRAKVCAMLRAYSEIWRLFLPVTKPNGRFKPRPIINPKTGRWSRTFNLASRFDGFYRLEDGRWMLYELRSTSESLKEAGQVLAHSIQPHLHLSMVPETVDLAGICVDIVKKPVAPFKRAKPRGKKNAEEVMVEPLQDYEERCYRAYVGNPGRFFRRIMLPVDPNRIREAQAATWRIAQDIRDSGRHGYLACRGTNCKNNRGWCDYRAICWYRHTENYVHCEFAHEELELTA